ncbi:L-pipecolate oxidase [Hypsizygus marmoreus]|uniref:L-pipecolate oxidase n=1 Tax=Hypsizygus marmoreus TaxID=39966 RepID=A0A369JY58_HYPMA|nr:L-pipecolate oxidase [Hypsizygus marmoreus]
MSTLPNDRIIIIGAGCFGASTAYHLLKRGFTDVTILDRSPQLPAPDAASNDFNRIVRSSYADLFYTRLARDAIQAWKDGEWGDTYHESGVVVLGISDNQAYADEAYQNDLAEGVQLKPLSNAEAIRGVFSSHVPIAGFDKNSGYLNVDGGWANAGQGLSMMISKVTSLGGKILPGKKVINIARDNGSVRHVQCDDGTVYDASLVVIATGSWTPSNFPGLISRQKYGLATGQCVAMVQLTDEEAKIYKDIPVVLDFGTGFYIFPPTESGIVKMAIHSAGYTHTTDGVSTPRTITTDPERGLLIPKSNVQLLRKYLREVYPKLAEKPFSATRLCWYNDSPDGNWIIGGDPEDSSVVLATAGSGHAYKFLPIIGRLVADAIEGKLEPSVANKFAVERQYTSVDESRRDMVVAELDLNDLYNLE